MDISPNNDRFGLPLSLVEALEADPSTDAALLASYLTGAGSAGRPAGGAAARPAPVAAWTGPAGAADDMSAEVFDLDQLLMDPLIRMVMASDHIGEDDIRAVMHHARPPRPPADRPADRLAA